MKTKNIPFHYYFLLIIFISFADVSISRKWSIEDLVQNIKEWNYLNDPEDLITDKKLGPKIHTSYLKINYVYEKTDINLFYLSDVIEKYIYKRRQFVNDLYEAMLNATEINKSNMKKHHLFIVIFKKHDEVIIFGSSPELKKLLPADKVLNIEMEIKKAMKNKNNTPAAIVYLVFDKLQHLWKKHTINDENSKNSKNKNSNDYTFVKDIIYLGGSLSILSLFFYVLWNKNKNKIKRD